jgi:hypothetical protein
MYIVDRHAQPSGDHLVHRSDNGCSLLPIGDDCIEVGKHSDCDSAMKMALLKFSQVDGCPECLPECNDQATTESVNAAVLAAVTISNI